tara:strand:+ start:1251 stop:2036 length:786 start_codon:yes stop_codon:yes gene_type:complete
MHIQISDTIKRDTFVNLFQYMKQFTDYVNIIFNETEMFIQSMDNGRVLVFEIHLPKEWFDVYDIGNTSVTLGISTSLFYKVLNVRDRTQELSLETSHESSYLTIKLSNSSVKTIFDKQFEIPMIDINYELMDIPEKEHQAEFTLESVTFATLINQLKIFGEALIISCTEDNIHLSADSLELGKMMTNIPIDDLQEFAIEEDETLNLNFSLKYIHDICLYQKVSKYISIGISKDFPMKVTYPLGTNTENASLCFYIAPRMDD